MFTADETYSRVTVTGFRDGALALRRPNGSVEYVSAAGVAQVLIDSVNGMADLNEAEAQFQKGRLDDAALRYERALRSASGYWPDFIHYRLAQAYAGSGQLDRMITYFARVAEQSPVAAAELLPTGAEAGRTSIYRRAMARIGEESKGRHSAEYQALMKVLAYALRLQHDEKEARQHADEIARLDLPASIATAPVCRVKLAAIQGLIKRGAADLALNSLESTVDQMPAETLPEALILKGRALAARGSERDDLLAAGLAFMRVAIHFESNPLAPTALYEAARIHERIHRPEQAMTLYRECAEHPLTDDAVRAEAESDVARLDRALAR